LQLQVFSQAATAGPYPDQFECGQWPSSTDCYRYEPIPMRLTTLNIPLWHELKYPGPHLRHQWYNAAAKKLDGRLFDDPFPNFDSIPNIVGYGIRINERVNEVLILWWSWVAILITGFFVFVYYRRQFLCLWPWGVCGSSSHDTHSAAICVVEARLV
ncbi:hypothetical protein diail_2463, partial [Diaporthe ilicicola]